MVWINSLVFKAIVLIVSGLAIWINNKKPVYKIIAVLVYLLIMTIIGMEVVSQL